MISISKTTELKTFPILLATSTTIGRAKKKVKEME
jgi:hypothetical protein